MPPIDFESPAFWFVCIYGLVCLNDILVNGILYGRIAFRKKGSLRTDFVFPPVSVVICARNEAENLTEYLPKLLCQEYPEFEVVVVNDCSWDNTEDVLREYQKEFSFLKAIHVKEDGYYKHGKKFALMVGIKGARYDHLLLTDGDCFPGGKEWIKEMMLGFSEGKEIVLGYGPYAKVSSFLNKIIRYDAFRIGVQYLSLGLWGSPYMGVGRNLAYKKELFFKQKGFASHYHINSGDDDLFINQAGRGENTGVVLEEKSFTYSRAAGTWANWSRQKVRHLGTSAHYRANTKWSLAYLTVSNYLFWGLTIASVFLSEWWLFLVGIFVLRQIWCFFVLYKSSKKLNESDILPYFVLFDVLLLFLYPFWHIRRRFFKPAKWKT